MPIPRGRPLALAPLLFFAACSTTVIETGPRRDPDAPKRPDPKPVPPANALLEYYAHCIEDFKRHVGEYPIAVEELFMKPAGTTGWKGPYLDGRPPLLDDQKRPVAYTRTPTGFELRSPGSDGVAGNADDVVLVR